MSYRLIDANDLLDRLQRKKCGPANKKYMDGFNDCLMRVRSMVSEAPTICISESSIDDILKGVTKGVSVEVDTA